MSGEHLPPPDKAALEWECDMLARQVEAIGRGIYMIIPSGGELGISLQDFEVPPAVIDGIRGMLNRKLEKCRADLEAHDNQH